MKKGLLYAAAVALLLSLSCFHFDNPKPADLSHAIPSSEIVRLVFPGTGAEVDQRALEGEEKSRYLIAQFFIRTIHTVNGLNGLTYSLFLLFDDIRATTYTSEVAGGYVWGPSTPALSLVTLQFTLTEGPGDGFSYAYQVRPKDDPGAPFQDFITGNYVPENLVQKDVMQSVGRIVIDCDVYTSMIPTSNTHGMITIDYDTTAGGKIIDFTFEDFEAEGIEVPVDSESTYHYRVEPDLSGDFTFTLVRDVVEETPDLKEDVSINVRWIPEGDARADVLVTDGNLPTMVPPYERFEISECWDSIFDQVYLQETSYPAGGEPELGWPAGDPAHCVFSDPEFF